tara:strand:+ start:226 stop:435 length:210 start_codon:yes stop_codon:yes gene_type:complete
MARDEWANDEQWRKSSDGWVAATEKSRIRKEKLRLKEQLKLEKECNHKIEEWCEGCNYDYETGKKYDFI